MSWTDERVDLLKKLWADGVSADDIATQLDNTTRNAVIGKIHRLKLPSPKRKENKIDGKTKGVKNNVENAKLRANPKTVDESITRIPPAELRGRPLKLHESAAFVDTNTDFRADELAALSSLVSERLRRKDHTLCGPLFYKHDSLFNK